MDRQTVQWWITHSSELEEEVRTWKMYCQCLAGKIDDMDKKIDQLTEVALPAMDNCRIQHDDYDTVDTCHKCSAVKAFTKIVNS